MDRFRIPRKNGIGEDVLDLRPIYQAIEALQQQVAALLGTEAGGTASAQAEASTTDAVTAHVLEPNPHTQYLLTASFNFANLGSKPTTLAGYGITDAAAATHSHTIANVSGLQSALDGKAAVSHQHNGADITSGTVADARLPTSFGAKTFTGLATFDLGAQFKVVPELLHASGASYVRVPRIFVGGSDPGSLAADGDLWIT
jgi:hypothetical protein